MREDVRRQLGAVAGVVAVHAAARQVALLQGEEGARGGGADGVEGDGEGVVVGSRGGRGGGGLSVLRCGCALWAFGLVVPPFVVEGSMPVRGRRQLVEHLSQRLHRALGRAYQPAVGERGGGEGEQCAEVGERGFVKGVLEDGEEGGLEVDGRGGGWRGEGEVGRVGVGGGVAGFEEEEGRG